MNGTSEAKANSASEAGDYTRPTLTEAEVGTIIEVSPFSVARKRKAGAIAYHRVGAFIRYSLRDVDAYLERSRVPAKAERRAS